MNKRDNASDSEQNIKFELEPFNKDIPNKDLIDDLIRVSKILGKKSVKRDEYNQNGKYSASTYCGRFGSWNKSLEIAGLKINKRSKISNKELFENLKDVWISLGRQPRNSEMKQPLSRYYGSIYYKRFGTWRKALESFIKYVNEEEIEEENYSTNVKRKNPRHVSERLRFIVMKRDNFKCRFCGRSPATNPQIKLHVDHIVPYSKGGETVLENLQTLCSECNIGKSDLEL